jgi:DNA-binding IscR family transcriptional regulator
MQSEGFETLERAELQGGTETEDRFIANDMTGISIARELGLAFEQGRGPVSTDDVCAQLGIPGEFVQRFLDLLVDHGLLAGTSDPPGYVLARPPEGISLSEIADAVASTALAQPSLDDRDGLARIHEKKREALAGHSLKELLIASSPARAPRRDREVATESSGPRPA